MKLKPLRRACLVLSLCICCIVWASSAHGQIWQKLYGNFALDYSYAYHPTSDGGFVIFGGTQSFGSGSNDHYFIKTDASGTPQFGRAYGGTGNDGCFDGKPTADGGYIMVGYTQSFGAGGFDAYIIKTNATGTVQWSRAFGGASFDRLYSVVQTSDGGCIAAGMQNSTGFGGNDVYVIKLDGSGNTQWANHYGAASEDQAYGVQQTADGGYIVSGMTASTGAGGNDVLLLKLTAAGAVTFARTYGSTGNDFGYSVRQTADGGYAISCFTQFFGAGGNDYYLIKTDQNGLLQWSRTYGGASNDFAGFELVVTPDQGYALIGYTDGFGAGSTDYMLVRTDQNGAFQWAKTYGGTNLDYGYGITLLPSGGFLLSGNCRSFGAGNYDAMVLRTDASGFTGCNESNPILTVTAPATQEGAFAIGSGSFANVISPPTLTTNFLPTLGTNCQILPLTFNYFEGRKESAGIRLFWGVLQEDGGHYRVERAADGRSWTPIGTQAMRPAQGKEQEYTLLDGAPVPGANHYRIVTVSTDGQTTYSETVVVEWDVPGIAVFPNPVAVGQAITVRGESLTEVTVFDLAGNRVAREIRPDRPAEFKMRTDQFAVGTYLLRVRSAQGVAHRKLIVVD